MSEEIRKNDAPKLSCEEESSLWRECRDGSEGARERLILAYRPMVFWLARQFYVAYSVYPDLVQEGMLALITAVDRFDPVKKNKFSTYGYYRIRGQMVNFLQRVEARAPVPVEDDFLLQGDHSQSDAERIEFFLTLEEGLRQLPQRESDVVEALLIEGCKAQEVALREKLDISYVYKLQKKALSRLKSWFEGEKDATSEPL